MPETVVIPPSFNGPLESGNGGYSAAVAAALVEGPAVASLRAPVPLGTPLDVVRADDGSVRLMDGATLVIEVQPAAELQLVVPEPVGPEDARRASEAYRGEVDGPFSRCFVCGPSREDAYGVFAGAVAGRDLVASPWTPGAQAADAEGVVLPEFIGAVLDCPTYWALYPEGHPMSMLGRMQQRIDGPVRAGVEHVVIAWPVAFDGRKHHAGSAILTADGDVLAVAQALLIGPSESATPTA